MLCYILKINSELETATPRLRSPGNAISQPKQSCNPGAFPALGLEVTDDTGKPM
jgi:hypothetical protein